MRMNDYERRWDNPNRKWIYVHREVMEKKIGRKLLSNEHVHHIDENPKNNHPDNLKLVTPAEHAIIHRPARKKSTMSCKIDGCKNKYHGMGLCNKHYMQKFRPSRAKNPPLNTLKNNWELIPH